MNITNLLGFRINKLRVYRDIYNVFHIAGLQRNSNGGSFVDITYSTSTDFSVKEYNTIGFYYELQDLDLTDNYVTLVAADKNSETKFYIGRYDKDGLSYPILREYRPSANVYIFYNRFPGYDMLIRNTYQDDVVVVTGGAGMNYSSCILLYTCNLTNMTPINEQSIGMPIKSYKLRDAVYLQDHQSIYILEDDRDLNNTQLRKGEIIETDPYSTQTYGNSAYLWHLPHYNVIYNSIDKLGSDRFIAYGFDRSLGSAESYLVKNFTMQPGCVDYVKTPSSETTYFDITQTTLTPFQPLTWPIFQTSIGASINFINNNCFN